MYQPITGTWMLALLIPGLLAVALALDAAAAPGQGVISIDFVGRGTPMGSSETAGVVARSRWTRASGASRTTPLALVDETGATTKAIVTWRSDNVWSTNITDQAGNSRLMKGYLDTGNGSATNVTVSGLAGGAYDVYVYVDGDNGSASRTGMYRLSGSGITTTSINLTDTATTNFAGMFRQANNSSGNYVKFGINATGFTLTALPGLASNGTKRAPVNGIQIVPTSGPAGDFTLGTLPASQTVNAGASASYTVTIGALNGFAGMVSLSASGLPTGASASFTPAFVTGSGSATLNVTTAPSTPGQSQTLTISGTSGSLSHATTVTLVVVPPTFSISGVITPAAAGAGALVNLGGVVARSTVADALGHYSFTGLSNGIYAVMPSRSGYTFTPASRNVTISSASRTGIDFSAAAAPDTYTILGTISPVRGGAGATVMMTGAASATTTADSGGNYAFHGVPNGTYTIIPSNAGYAFAPVSKSVTISGADVTAVSFTAWGPTKDRANAYDSAWKTAWVDHGRVLLATSAKTGGFVLQIGDSITHSFAYAAWPFQGQGETNEDAQVLTWAQASDWSANSFDVTNTNGWYLAGANTTSQRGLTASGGLSLNEFVSGCCNGGPTMPASTNPPMARQLLADPTYTGNLQVDTVLAGFGHAQGAVVMLGTNDPGNPNAVADLTMLIDKLEAAHILPILSTVPPRHDAFSDQLNVEFNAAVTRLAQERSLPLIDFYQEILLRRPGTTWLNTLISNDGVHPTATGAGFTLDSNPYVPGGDAATHTTGDALLNVGYLLRSWLTVQKLKEVHLYVIEGIDPP